MTTINKWNALFAENEIEQLQTIKKLFKQNIQYSQEDLKELLTLAIEKKDMSVLGYCLAYEAEDKPIDYKEELFLKACQNNFIHGAQLLAPMINLQQIVTTHDYDTNNLTLLNQALLIMITHEDFKPGLRFLLNENVNLRFDDDYLFIYAYHNNYLKAVEYLIRKDIGIDVRNNIIEKDMSEENQYKFKKIKEIFNHHQYQKSQVNEPLKELPKTVTHRKI